MYYFPILIVLVLSYFISKGLYKNIPLLLKWLNISVVFTLLYAIILGMYFKNYTVEHINGEYPSLYISKWASSLLYFAVIPADAIYCIYRVFKK